MDNTRSNVIVGVRVRPLNKEELLKNPYQMVHVIDGQVLVFDTKDTPKTSRRGAPNYNARPKDATFAFDRVFSESSTSEDIFNQTTRLLVDEVMKGFNCTCFAYGATGAGKTFTMIGNTLEPGVMVLTMRELFKKIEEVKSEKEYQVKVSYLEVYNEQIRDLLIDNSPSLALRDNEGREAIVTGLSSKVPINTQEVLNLLEQGNLRRSQSPTEANSQSSRSHAIFQVTVQHKDIIAGTSVRSGKLSLIDLAGSERAAQMRNNGKRLVEGANINKSLLALGNCINALCSGYRKGKYVPYRGSKLTRLLKDSLGGNCKTVMIANVSPSYSCYEDSWNTLQYANRAKNIQTSVWLNEKQVKYHVSQYREIMSNMQEEVTRLREKCAMQEIQAIERANKNDAIIIDRIKDIILCRLDFCSTAIRDIDDIHLNNIHLLNLIFKKELDLCLHHEPSQDDIRSLNEEKQEMNKKMIENNSNIESILRDTNENAHWLEKLRTEIDLELTLLKNKAILYENLTSLKAEIERVNTTAKIKNLEFLLQQQQYLNQILSAKNQHMSSLLRDPLSKEGDKTHQPPSTTLLSGIPLITVTPTSPELNELSNITDNNSSKIISQKIPDSGVKFVDAKTVRFSFINSIPTSSNSGISFQSNSTNLSLSPHRPSLLPTFGFRRTPSIIPGRNIPSSEQGRMNNRNFSNNNSMNLKARRVPVQNNNKRLSIMSGGMQNAYKGQTWNSTPRKWRNNRANSPKPNYRSNPINSPKPQYSQDNQKYNNPRKVPSRVYVPVQKCTSGSQGQSKGVPLKPLPLATRDQNNCRVNV